MAISSITGTSSSTTSSSGLSSLTNDEFLTIMMEEMSNQDPLNPSDTSKLMEQISTLRSIQSQMDLQSSLEDLVTQNQITTASSLIGKTVAGLNDSNDQISGLVTSITVSDGKAILQLDTGNTLQLSKVTQVANQTSG